MDSDRLDLLSSKSDRIHREVRNILDREGEDVEYLLITDTKEKEDEDLNPLYIATNMRPKKVLEVLVGMIDSFKNNKYHSSSIAGEDYDNINPSEN